MLAKQPYRDVNLFLAKYREFLWRAAFADAAGIGGPSERDECLRFPVWGQVEYGARGFGAEERSAHPAGAELVAGGGEEDAVDGAGDGLAGHPAFGSGAALVRVDVHIGHGEAGEQGDGSGGDAIEAAAGIAFDQVGRVAVAGAIDAQAVGHGGGEAGTGGATQNGEAPGLAVMRGGSG